MKFPFNKPILVILVSAFMLTGCVLPRPQRDAPDSELTPIFIPPELHPATPTPDASKSTGKNPEQDLNCVDGLSSTRKTVLLIRRHSVSFFVGLKQSEIY